MAGPPIGGWVVTFVGGSISQEATITLAKLEEVAKVLGIKPKWIKENTQSIYVFRSPDNGGGGGGT